MILRREKNFKKIIIIWWYINLLVFISRDESNLSMVGSNLQLSSNKLISNLNSNLVQNQLFYLFDNTIYLSNDIYFSRQ